MTETEKAVLDMETGEKEQETNLNLLFSRKLGFDTISHFILARDLQVSPGIISEIESIEMEEGFIY